MRFVFSIELYHLVDGFEQEFIAPLSSWTVIQRQVYPLPTPRARAAQRGPRAGTRRSPGLVRRRVWPGRDCARGRRAARDWAGRRDVDRIGPGRRASGLVPRARPALSRMPGPL